MLDLAPLRKTQAARQTSRKTSKTEKKNKHLAQAEPKHDTRTVGTGDSKERPGVVKERRPDLARVSDQVSSPMECDMGYSSMSTSYGEEHATSVVHGLNQHGSVVHRSSDIAAIQITARTVHLIRTCNGLRRENRLRCGPRSQAASV